MHKQWQIEGNRESANTKVEGNRHKTAMEMSTKTEQNITNAVRPTTKETNAHTKRKVDTTEVKVAETRMTEGTGNQREIQVGVSAIIATRAVTKKITA